MSSSISIKLRFIKLDYSSADGKRFAIQPTHDRAQRYRASAAQIGIGSSFARQIFKDAMMTAAAIDRLVHHSVIIELNIPSYRAEQALKNKEAEGLGENE